MNDRTRRVEYGSARRERTAVAGYHSFQTPSNFVLIKEDVGGVAGYVGVLFFYRTIEQ